MSAHTTPLRDLRIALVEDQPLYRQMLSMLLSSEPGLKVVAVCSSAAAAREIPPRDIDVALLDLRLGDGDGMTVGREMRKLNPALGVLILSASDSMQVLLDVPQREASGWGFLSKTSTVSAGALVYAIRAVAQGRNVLDPSIREQREVRRMSPLAQLSPRQREVLSLVAQGLTNAAIADQLGLSPRSVDAHLNAVYAGLDVKARTDRNARVEAVRAYLAYTVPSVA